MRRLGHHFSFSSIVRVTLAYVILLAALSVLLSRYSAASAGTLIPDDAIRVRIIANSDSAFDQQVKREVRDRVSTIISSWGTMPFTHDEARDLIASRLPQIEAAAVAVLADRKANYGAEAELAKVPFPDKMFNGRAYAAGDYEALRITLGGGEGANWWCVLFPPLCLTAATAPGDDPAIDDGKAAAAKADGKTPEADPVNAANEKPEARFFLWELLQKIGEFLKALFS